MAAAHPDPGSAAAAARPRSDLRQLALIVAVEFVVNCGFGVIYPYLPLFLKDETGAHVWMIGVIAGATFVGTFLFSSPLGRLSDTLGRKPVIVAGAALFSLAMFLFATTTDPWWFVAFRFLEGVGIAASLPAGNAFVAYVTADHQRSRAFGWLTTAQFGGLILGPAIGVGLYSLGGGERAGYLAIFLTGGCLTAAMAVVLAVFLREPARAPAPAASSPPAQGPGMPASAPR
jgi:DHA1 family multidrug resistance protein-like MFS transporter